MIKRILLGLFIYVAAISSRAEDGSRLWLRYDTVNTVPQIECGFDSPVVRVAAGELSSFWKGGKVSLQLIITVSLVSVHCQKKVFFMLRTICCAFRNAALTVPD